MKLLRYLYTAIEIITTHRLRAILTMLGIVVSVAALLITVGIGRGARVGITAKIEKEGTNLITVYPLHSGNSNTLTISDAEALKVRLMSNLKSVVPEYAATAHIVFDGVSIQNAVVGTTEEYAAVHNLQFENGAFFNKEDINGQRCVVVLPTKVAKKLFKTTDHPINQIIRIENEPCLVKGILTQGSSGEDFSLGRAYVPIKIAQSRLFNIPHYRGEYTITALSLQVASLPLLKSTEYPIEQILRLRHLLNPEEKNDFGIFNQAKLLDISNGIAEELTILLVSLGTVSLLVGGIGIMNIMLASVTERTREIGLRKAVGASDSDILLQFLIETMVISGFGGITGIALSIGIAFLMRLIPKDLYPFDVVIEGDIVLLALVVSISCGFAFGIYPAIRATRLDPIEALRCE